MVKIMRGPVARGIAVGAGEEPTDSPGSFEGAAQVGTASIRNRRCVVAIPFLNHAEAVVNVAGLRIQAPVVAGSVLPNIMVLQALAESAKAVIHPVR